MERLSGYENVEHVLRLLAEFHRHLADIFASLAVQCSDQRSAMVLEYLSGHQTRRSAALEHYRKDAPASLLNNWFQIPFPEDPESLLRSVDQPADMTESQINERLRQIDAFMERLLQHMANRAETANVKRLFGDLLDIETREQLLRSRAISSFSQI